MVEFRILGPLEVSDGGQPVDVRPAKVRALLGMLLLHPNEVVSTERLIEGLWGEAPPASATNTLQGYVSQLRQALERPSRPAGDRLVVTRPPGYLLAIEPDLVDARRFERLAFEGRAALVRGDTRAAARTLEEALALWRGPALEEFAYEAFVRDEATRLEELWARATEDHIDAELALGHHLEVLGEVKALTAAAPLRERRWGQLILTLYRAGRQADALRAYQDLRRLLADELGIDPNPELQRLEAAVLAQDPMLWGLSGEPLPSLPAVPPAPTLRSLPMRLRRSREFPFVARQPSLSLLSAEWARAIEGDQRLVLVAGEPGVGKTRLAAEAAIAAHEAGAVVLFGRCDAELRIPYQPFAEALADLTKEWGPAQLREQLGWSAGELVRLWPEIRSRMPDLVAPVSSDPESELYRLFDAVAQWLRKLIEVGPIFFLLDDLQWAARPTLLLLRHVLRLADPLPLLVVGTYRHTGISDDHPLNALIADLRREHRVTTLSLEGLDDSGVRAFLEAAIGHSLDERGHDVSSTVRAGTGGNPFFLGEVVRYLRESGRVAEDGGRWLIDPETLERQVPHGVRDVVRSRVAKLSDATRRLLVQAAVTGDEFELAPLAVAAALPEEELTEAVEQAVGAGLLVELACSAPRYRFAHALVRTSLYEELSAARRLHLHRRAGVGLEAVHRDRWQRHLPELAYHFAIAAAGGQDVEKAIHYLTCAGEAALSQLAHDQAALFFRQALDLDELWASERTPCARRCDLLLSLGESQRRAGSAEYRETLLEAAGVAEASGDAERLTQAALTNSRAYWSITGGVDVERERVLVAALDRIGEEDSAARAQLLATLAVERVYVCKHDETRRLSDEALAMAHRLDDLGTLARVLGSRYNTIRGDPGTLVERLDNTVELVRVGGQLGDPVIVAVSLGWRALAQMEAGRFVEAKRDWDHASQFVTALRQPTLQWYWTYMGAAFAMFEGRFDEGERLSAEALRLGEAAGHPDAGMFRGSQRLQLAFERGKWAGWDRALKTALAKAPDRRWFVLSWHALLRCELDRVDAAREVFEQLAINDFAEYDFEPAWLHTMANLAAVAAYLGDERRSATLFELLRPYASQTVTMVSLAYSGAVAYYLGLLSKAMHRLDEAKSYLREAAAVHERAGAPVWLARTRLAWADVLLQQKWGTQDPHPIELLHQVIAVADEHGATRVAQRGREALDRATVTGRQIFRAPQ